MRYTNYGSLGEIAVDVFFVISGYLITGSYLRSRDVVDYLRKRALRLFPALWCAVLFATVFLGPLVTKLPLSEYFTNSQTRTYLGNLYLNTSYLLPGVFVGNPYPNAVNGSLWTLPAEVFMYLVVMVLGMLSRLNRTTCLGAVLLFACLYFVLPPERVPFPRFLMPLLPYFETTRLGIFFFAGASLVFVRQDWMAKWYLMLAALLLLVLLTKTFFAPIWLIVLLPYLVIALAHTQSKVSAAVSRAGDFSYGVYVYAFPTQQTAALLLGPKVSALTLFAVSMPATLVLAFASWHLVEKPALRLKSRLSRKGAAGEQSSLTLPADH